MTFISLHFDWWQRTCTELFLSTECCSKFCVQWLLYSHLSTNMGLALLSPSVISEIYARLFLNGHANPAVQILKSLVLTSVLLSSLTQLVRGWLAGPHAVSVKPQWAPVPHFPSHAAAVAPVGQWHPPWGSASLSLPGQLSAPYKCLSSCLKTHSREPGQIHVILKK